MIVFISLNIIVSLILWKKIYSPIFRGYLLINFLLFLNPAILFLLTGAKHPQYDPNTSNYSLALSYIAIFNILLGISYKLSYQLVPVIKKFRKNLWEGKIDKFINSKSLITANILIFIFAYFCKYILDILGAFRMGGIVSGFLPFLQLTKVLASMDLFAIIMFSQIRRKTTSNKRLINNVFFISIVATLVSSVYTGSRGATLLVIIITLVSYWKEISKKKFFLIPIFAVAFPYIFGIFPILSAYRNFNYNWSEAFRIFELIDYNPLDIMVDTLVSRLNYLETVARAINNAIIFGPEGGELYLDNFLGLIPRLFWPDKPEITTDGVLIGHTLELLNYNDEKTSVGLSVIGESFFHFGWLGLWVSSLQGFIFAFITKNCYRPSSAISMTIFTYSAINILKYDGYFAVLPGLIWLLIIIFIYLYILKKLLPNRIPE